ncbi:MAG TPA: dihydrofolate reductase family protein [Candidatus Saccharimonadales bacterium]|nr:dihydrofolate reductase family protein [Candidatus Saccharimonadales bacterium]
MGEVFADISVSLDGFVAGPNPTLKEPLGHGGEQLHDWVLRLQAWRKPHGKPNGETGPGNDLFQATIDRTGAVIMGRKMFSGGEGPWENDPNPDGWWGDNPPFHVPVFILTSHPREKVVKKGGTTFTFVTDGIESALAQAKVAVGDKDVSVSGGANVIQQFISAGLLHELEIHVVPILLGGGTRLLDNLEPGKLKKVRVIDHPLVTHLKFQLKK